jgi:hypothetical protein
MSWDPAALSPEEGIAHNFLNVDLRLNLGMVEVHLSISNR